MRRAVAHSSSASAITSAWPSKGQRCGAKRRRACSERGFPRKVHGSWHIPERIVGRYAECIPVAAEKTVAVSFRVPPRPKRLLEAAAMRQNRLLTNMLETLLLAYAEQLGLEVAPAPITKTKARVK